MLTTFTHQLARRLRWIEQQGWRYRRAGALAVGLAQISAAITMLFRWILRRLAPRHVNTRYLSIEQRRIAR